MRFHQVFILFLMLTSLNLWSQQEAQFTQYMYNTVVVNPAYAGSRGMLSFFGQYRAQWIGLEGAPVNQVFTMNTPIGESGWGTGMSFMNESVGPINNANIHTDLSYSIQTSENFKLSMGIKFSVQLFSLDVNRLNAFQPEDPTFQSISATPRPNVGAGVFWHSDKFYLGLSTPSFFETSDYNDNEIKVFKERLTTYFIGGYVYDLNETWQMKPAFLIKSTYGAPMQTDISLNFQGYEKIVLGSAWRNSGSFSGLAGFQINPTIFFGYTYDSETTALRRFNSGSHELFLRFEILPTNKKIVSPRFF